MTSNGVVALILRYFTLIRYLYIPMRPTSQCLKKKTTMSAEYGIPVLAKNWPTLRRGLSAVAEVLVTQT